MIRPWIKLFRYFLQNDYHRSPLDPETLVRSHTRTTRVMKGAVSAVSGDQYNYIDNNCSSGSRNVTLNRREVKAKTGSHVRRCLPFGGRLLIVYTVRTNRSDTFAILDRVNIDKWKQACFRLKWLNKFSNSV